MELKIAMVKFFAPKNLMTKKTDSAILFDLGKDKAWIPFTKLQIKPCDDELFNEVIMPRWIFLKTNLPLHFKTEEFEYVANVEF